MSEDIKWLWSLLLVPLTWLFRLIWISHVDIQKIKSDHPTWSDLKAEMQEFSDQNDKSIDSLKDDTKYIRDRVDKLVDIHLDKK